jgi:hypothetical protein
LNRYSMIASLSYICLPGVALTSCIEARGVKGSKLGLAKPGVSGDVSALAKTLQCTVCPAVFPCSGCIRHETCQGHPTVMKLPTRQAAVLHHTL